MVCLDRVQPPQGIVVEGFFTGWCEPVAFDVGNQFALEDAGFSHGLCRAPDLLASPVHGVSVGHLNLVDDFPAGVGGPKDASAACFTHGRLPPDHDVACAVRRRVM